MAPLDAEPPPPDPGAGQQHPNNEHQNFPRALDEAPNDDDFHPVDNDGDEEPNDDAHADDHLDDDEAGANIPDDETEDETGAYDQVDDQAEAYAQVNDINDDAEAAAQPVNQYTNLRDRNARTPRFSAYVDAPHSSRSSYPLTADSAHATHHAHRRHETLRRQLHLNPNVGQGRHT